jgi:hypothetical protein
MGLSVIYLTIKRKQRQLNLEPDNSELFKLEVQFYIENILQTFGGTYEYRSMCKTGSRYGNPH